MFLSTHQVGTKWMAEIMSF